MSTGPNTDTVPVENEIQDNVKGNKVNGREYVS